MLRSTWLSAAKWKIECTPLTAASHGVAVGDVALDEAIARMLGDIGEVGEIAGVGEAVEVDDGDLRFRFEQVVDEVAADEAAAAGDENRSSCADRFPGL